VELDEFAEEASRGLLRQQNARLRAEVKAAQAELDDALGQLRVLEGIDRLDPRPPKWTSPRKPGPRQAVVVAMLSDTHFDEIVRPEDIAGVNAYDRTIATRRLQSWAEQLVHVAESGPEADLQGAVVLWGGDMMTGPIDVMHLQESADTMFGTLLYWSEQLAAAFTLIADQYGKVHVPVVVGNHGRMEKQKRSHLKARSNLDWHLAALVARLTADDKRITWQIDEASDAEFEVMGQRHLLTHGDQTRGGGGIGGIWPPLMRLHARKQARQSALGRPFDHLWLGHWHQATFGPAFTVNGSLVGYSAFSAECNFPVEPPQQVVAFVDRERIAWRTTIVV
jgi:hypothetical protein